jgi:O-antigen/teichoic acid export membrane protein
MFLQIYGGKMIKPFKELFAETAVYGVARVLSGAITIILVPVYTSEFLPADYGIFSLLNTTLTLLLVLIIFGLDNSSATWFYLYPDSKVRKEIFSSWFIFSLLMSLLLALLLYIFRLPFSELLFDTDKYSYLISYFSLVVLFSSFSKIPNILFRFQRRPKMALLQTLGSVIVNVTFAWIFVKNLQMGVMGALYALIITGLLNFIFCIYTLLLNFGKLRFNINLLREMINFSLPLMPVSLLIWGQGGAMIYLLNLFISRDEVGIYQSAVTLAGVASVASGAFLQAWGPYSLSKRENHDSKELYAKVVNLYFFLGVLLVILISLTSKFIFSFFTNESYLAGASILGLLCFNVILAGIPQVFSIVNNLTKNNKSLLKSYLLGNAVTLLSFFIFIESFQKEAAVFAMTVGNTFMCVYNFYQSQRMMYLPINKSMLIFCYAIGLLSSLYL